MAPIWYEPGHLQRPTDAHIHHTCKHTHTHTTHTHTHTHVKHTNRSIYITNICITSNLLVMIGCQKSEKTNGQWPRGSHPDMSYYFVKQGVLDLVWSWPRFKAVLCLPVPQGYWTERLVLWMSAKNKTNKKACPIPLLLTIHIKDPWGSWRSKKSRTIFPGCLVKIGNPYFITKGPHTLVAGVGNVLLLPLL